MKILTLLLSCCIMINSAVAQVYDPSKVNKKAIALYQQAIERAENGNLTNAVGFLLESIKVDPKYLDAYLSLAGVYGQMKNYGASVDYYNRSFAMDPGYTIEYKLPYSINLAGLGKFNEALEAINELLEKNPPKNSKSLKAAEYRKRTYEFALAYEKERPSGAYVFAPLNAGTNINSNQSEYFPSLTIDKREMVFTRRVNGANEDFYVAAWEGDGWAMARPASGSVNTDQNEGAQNISQDGEWLVFTGCNRRDGFGGCDIYISFREKEGWSEAINLESKINTAHWESQPCLSPDKRSLYFASSRPGGLGGIDLYVSHLQDNGKWSDPENLGPGINTPGNEQSPFIHADNQTLYFTSDHWPGYGEADLFMARKGPNEVWSKPINLGYPINTISHEGTLFVTADGSTAYYSSDRNDTRGGLDIYSFKLRDDIKPFRTLWVEGKVFDKKTTKGLPSTVELIDIKGGQVVSKVRTDETGKYLITLPVGRDYVFNVNRKGYLFFSDTYRLIAETTDSVYRKDIPLQPIEVNASVVLNNIFFDVSKFDLKNESVVELDRVAQLLRDNPSIRIQIGGHTDNAGKPADNLALSNSRAKTVVAYLINKGIAASRLTAKGFGETQPVADNNTEAGRARNRRTEMKVIAL